ncbi:nitroreductase family protein [Stenotrophomonas sp. ATCM1_4]|uniref:Nitroreductase family protein n=1 Tax=Stenotrophomonas capsici TaxID=3110230 RepID=A0ABU5V0M5_9GAMM|nr:MULTISPECIES: nitroreductase family protein [unclassified Stenotrophomonas]MBD9534951.1 nitroreductase family protein [Stenotrophomonas sp. STM01]MEA5666329.1 nitroreductase family protein [Stenotrophomonas sp. MH1]TDB28133.1 nitroreductase family protein [Stenotrophomonas sp. ATCM1_4]
MSSQAISLFKKRRSQYALGKSLPVSQNDVTHLIKQAVREAPSAFNAQSSRAVILFGAESQKFWERAKDELRKIVPAEAFAATEGKLNSFAAGAGTVLFFVDTDVVKGLQEQFALYADNFPVWAEQSNGMAQFAVWTALADADIGASLQHYNPLVDQGVREAWGVPAHWTLRAQMPFGSNEAPHGEKTYMEDEARFKVFG